MPTCPACGADADEPNYRKRRVEPTADRGGVTVTATTAKQYWMVLCPACDAVLGTLDAD